MRSFPGVFAAGICSAIVIAGVSVSTDAPAFASEEQAVAGGLIVTTTSNSLSTPTVAAIENITNSDVTAVDESSKNTHIVVLEESLTESELNQTINELEQRNDIVSVSANLLVTPDAFNPVDPLYATQFGLVDKRATINDGISTVKVSSGAYSTRADQLWRKTTGDTSVVVAVLDTGVLFDHPDLQDQLLDGYDFVSSAASARDQDASGGNTDRDVDPSDPGDWARTEENVDLCPDEPVNGMTYRRSSWHGTGVASVIAAKADTQGIVGVAPGVKILPVRVMGCGGGLESDVADAITWASGGVVSGVANVSAADKADVINMSFSASKTYPSKKSLENECKKTITAAVSAARSRGTIVVASKGNSNSKGYHFPADCPGVIGVAASDELGKRAYYSNYGGTTDITAPGGAKRDVKGWRNFSNIGVASNEGTTSPTNQTWKTTLGTSFSAPYVSGGAALLMSLGYNRAETEVAIKAAVRPFPKYTNKTRKKYNCTTSICGKGLLDLSRVPWMINSATISGTTTNAATLTAKSSWAGSPKLSYQWYRNGSAIKKATKSTYKLTNSDVGKQIKVKVTAKKSSFKTMSTTSAATSAVLQRASVSGTMKNGKTLTAKTSSWPTLNYTYSYQWYRNGKAISGATAVNYQLTSKDKAKKIKVKITITSPGQPTVWSTSAERTVAK